MVLQSVTRAVTRPMGRRLRKGLPRFGKRITLVSRVPLFFFSFHFSLGTGELDGCHFSRDRWSPGRIDRVSSFNDRGFPPPSVSRVSRLDMVIFTRHCLQEQSSLLQKGVSVEGVKVWLLKTQYSRGNDTSRFLRDTPHLFCGFFKYRLYCIIIILKSRHNKVRNMH